MNRIRQQYLSEQYSKHSNNGVIVMESFRVLYIGFL